MQSRNHHIWLGGLLTLLLVFLPVLGQWHAGEYDHAPHQHQGLNCKFTLIASSQEDNDSDENDLNHGADPLGASDNTGVPFDLLWRNNASTVFLLSSAYQPQFETLNFSPSPFHQELSPPSRAPPLA